MGLSLAERKVVLRRNLPEARDAESVYPCNGRAKAVAAFGELINFKQKIDVIYVKIR